MKIPSPGDLNLNIPSWRPAQEEGIGVMITSKMRETAVCAPTGWGKSFANIATGLITGKPTCIVTQSRGLQAQYLKDGASVGMVSLMGRRNYQCDMRDDYTCEEGYAARCPYKGSVGCPASQAEMRAATSPLVVTNFSKWVAAKKFGQGMAHFQQVIFDEGDQATDALSSAMQVILHHREIEDKLEIPFPVGAHAENMSGWKDWAANARAVAEIEMLAARERIAGLSDPKPSWVRHFTHMRNLNRRLNILASCRADEWIVDEVKDAKTQTHVGYQFDPIRPGRYAESALLFRMPRIIYISATIRPKTLYMLGRAKGTFDFKEYDSTFNPKRAPIYYIPTMRVDWRNRDAMSLLWLKLDQIAAKRRDRKGLVQTMSFTRQKDIIEASRFSDSMIFNEQGEPTAQVIDDYIQSGPGTILVSPSVGIGYDFADDLCRWNFMCKIPFDPPSKILKAREADDKEYRPYRAIQKLVQGFGRDVRSEKDWSERFICDEHLDWFMKAFGHLAPSSFHAFIKKVQTVPQPPRLEDMAA